MKQRNKNIQQENLIRELKKLSIEQDVKFWKRIATELEKPSRNKRVVNLSKISKYAKDGDLIVVPGKVLSSGELNHKIKICAYRFSESAKVKIKNSGSEILTITQLMSQNPKAKGVKIIG